MGGKGLGWWRTNVLQRKVWSLIPFQEPPDDDFRERIEKLERTADKMGLYLQGIAIGGLPNPDDEEEAQPLLLATFAVGSEAFSDRVMNPEKYDEDGKFRELAIEADPIDIIYEELRAEVLAEMGEEEPDESSEEDL